MRYWINDGIGIDSFEILVTNNDVTKHRWLKIYGDKDNKWYNSTPIDRRAILNSWKEITEKEAFIKLL